MRTWTIVAATALTLGGCTAPADESGAEQPAATQPAKDRPAPEVFAATAWLAVAADGARYTTMLDPDGRYRDFRNGDAWQEGSWTYADGGQGKILCFTPESEGALERCWEPGRMRGDTLRAKSDAGLTIELERVDYRAPAKEADESA